MFKSVLSCSLLVRVLVASCKKLNYIYRMDALVHWSSAQLLHDVSTPIFIHRVQFLTYSVSQMSGQTTAGVSLLT